MFLCNYISVCLSVYQEREVCFKELVHVIKEASKSKICSVGQQAGDQERTREYVMCTLHTCWFPSPGSLLLLKMRHVAIDSLVTITIRLRSLITPEEWIFSQGSSCYMCVCGVGWPAAVGMLGWPPAFLRMFPSQTGAKASTSLEPGER